MKNCQIIPYTAIVYGIFFLSLLAAKPVPQSEVPRKSAAFLQVKKPKYNFGFVRQGTVVKIEYFFRNTGADTLRISNIEVTCGCTAADFPHYPIKPGDSGSILLTFNTKEKYDRQDRTVSVISNAANSPTKLRFKGIILENKGGKNEK